MWLLESDDAFDGRRMWLRPGKTYLFGRRASEAGRLAISHSTISRKHLTVVVESVQDGHAHDLTERSKLIIEDLATKTGTVVNGTKIRGSKYLSNGEDLDVTMGKCPSKFRIVWFPVVFTFSFTQKELQADPLAKLRQQFEQLDIKLLTDYDIQHTTHVVARKRNTAKGLQALINGKSVVTETFLDALTQATDIGAGSETSALEQDFERAWPDALQHLPPRGGEPVQHPDSIYAPDTGRKDVFDGYTFIFYDNTQFSNLMAPITNGSGKAIMRAITPEETPIDDFVRYVKQEAGEKGLGSFEDGSEGKGVVVVRYIPAKGEHINWYAAFITQVSLRLDHRPIEQNEFLEAILIKDASILRRPLEVETPSGSQAVGGSTAEASSTHELHEQAQPTEEHRPQRKVKRPTRGPVKRRFAGFDNDSDMDESDASMPAGSTTQIPAAMRSQDENEENGLFVSQEQDAPETQPEVDAQRNAPSRKRRAPLEDDLMDGMAPAAAMFKRQRLEQGDQFASPSPEPEPHATVKAPTKRQKEKLDVLAMASRHREEAEARARAERDDLANLPEDVDLAEIRRLHIVEELDVRVKDGGARTREQDMQDGRWNPRWNGIQNFKKFRRRGQEMGREPVRTIVALQEVKTKEYGIGDNYWLEDENDEDEDENEGDGERRRPRNSLPQRGRDTSQMSGLSSRRGGSSRKSAAPQIVASVEDDEEQQQQEEEEEEDQDVDMDEDEEEPAIVPATLQQSARLGGSTGTSRGTSRVAATPSQTMSPMPASRQTRGRQDKKRGPEEEASLGPMAKRQRLALQATELEDSEEGSEDELKFKFGKRR
ncbi:hypothetical protein E4U45_003443 [Claviceps purpurea]|nr:hypothetical protein E4U45_003443 [Claviceps purpurea]